MKGCKVLAFNFAILFNHSKFSFLRHLSGEFFIKAWQKLYTLWGCPLSFNKQLGCRGMKLKEKRQNLCCHYSCRINGGLSFLGTGTKYIIRKNTEEIKESMIHIPGHRQAKTRVE